MIHRIRKEEDPASAAISKMQTWVQGRLKKEGGVDNCNLEGRWNASSLKGEADISMI